MAFGESVRNKAFVSCRRSCCICHKFAGLKMEVHHIKLESEGGENTFENAIPLCFDCHADMRSYDSNHPKGSKYTRRELVQHRDKWYGRISSTPEFDYNYDLKELDRAVYSETLKTVSWNRSIKLAREHTFSSPFINETFDEFHSYIRRSSDPAFEFIDSDLEPIRIDLVTAIVTFVNLLEANTFWRDDNVIYSAVPNEWKHSQRDVFYKAVADLQAAGDRVGEAYDTFVRSARRKLGV